MREGKKKIYSIEGSILANPNILLLEFLVVFSTIVLVVLIISASKQHRMKKSPLTRTLLRMYVGILINLMLEIISVLFDIFEIPLLSSELDLEQVLPMASNPALILTHTFFFQALIYVMLVTAYYMFTFVRLVFIEVEEKYGKYVNLVKIMIVGAVAGAIVLESLALSLQLYSIIRLMGGESIDIELVKLSIFVLPVVPKIISFTCTIFVYIPVLIGAPQIRRRTSKNDPHQSNLLYLTIWAVISLLNIGIGLLDTFLIGIGVPYPTPAIFLMWAIFPFQNYAAYRGLFSHKSAPK